jgi:U3 small nucleolar RNA-associated protein 7
MRPIARKGLVSLAFCPYEDVLLLGHKSGAETIVVPGAGDPQIDSRDPNPYENKGQRREREVRQLLEKISPDMICLDPTKLGKVAGTAERKAVPASMIAGAAETKARLLAREEPAASDAVGGKKKSAAPAAAAAAPASDPAAGDPSLATTEEASDLDDGEASDVSVSASEEDTPEARERRRMRGRNKAQKKFLRKQGNVWSKKRALIEAERSQAKRRRVADEAGTPAFSVLDRFAPKR